MIMSIVVLCAAAPLRAEGPVPLAGVDPGGMAIALIGGGIDYREPAIARRLARDGEGELIGRDIAANDARPFQAIAASATGGGGDSNAIVARLRPAAALRVIAVKAAADELPSLVRAIAFAGQTPARVIVLPLAGLYGPSGEMVRQAATRYPAKLFVLGLAEEPDGTLPIASGTGAAPTLRIGNLLLVSLAVDAKAEPHLAELLVEVQTGVATPAQRLTVALAETLSALACQLATNPTATATDLKTAILARADPLKATGGRRVLVSPCP